MTEIGSAWTLTGVALPGEAALPALGLGFLLGLRHSLDADHLIAVTTLASEGGGPWRSSAIGAFWGVGHTSSLLAVSALVIALRVTIPNSVAQTLEMGVAAMLVALGLNALRRALGLRIHRHVHRHGASEPAHTHVHVHLGEPHEHAHPHLLQHARRPVLIGMVHGMAGSAALMLLVLTTLPTAGLALLYVFLFGLGSIVSMCAASWLISLPLDWTSRRFAGAERGLQLAAGAASVAFGVSLGWQLAVQSGLLLPR